MHQFTNSCTGKRKNYTGIRLCALLLTTGLALTGCNPSSPSNPPLTTANPDTAGNPSAAEVTKRDIIEQIPLSGQLVVPPPAQASVAEPFKSPVERIYKGVGDYVKRGEALVELGIPSAEAYREQTKISLQQAQAEYNAAQTTWNPRIASAKQALKEAETAVSQARKYARAAGDPDTGTLSGASEVDPAPPATDLQTALENRRVAEQELQQLRADMRVELQPYSASIAEARAALNQAKADDNAGLVKAPISGVITTLNAQPGQEPDGSKSTPIAVIVNLDAIQIHAPMAPNYASQVKEGMNVIATFDEVPGKEFNGRVKQITTRNNRQEYVAIITFTNTGYQVKPGYRPHIGITTGRKVEDEPAVPAEAVDYADNEWFVQVRRDEKWAKVPVTPGVSDGKFTSIKSGLSVGDTVLVTPGN